MVEQATADDDPVGEYPIQQELAHESGGVLGVLLRKPADATAHREIAAKSVLIQDLIAVVEFVGVEGLDRTIETKDAGVETVEQPVSDAEANLERAAVEAGVVEPRIFADGLVGPVVDGDDVVALAGGASRENVEDSVSLGKVVAVTQRSGLDHIDLLDCVGARLGAGTRGS